MKVNVRRGQWRMHRHAHLTLGVHIVAKIQKGGGMVYVSIGSAPEREGRVACDHGCGCMLVEDQ
jgi:hypothetical protein